MNSRHPAARRKWLVRRSLATFASIFLRQNSARVFGHFEFAQPW